MKTSVTAQAHNHMLWHLSSSAILPTLKLVAGVRGLGL